MFSHRGLIVLFVCLAGCVPFKKKELSPAAPVDSGIIVSQEYQPDRIYEIVVLSNDTGKLTESYFALGRDVHYDVISQEIIFKTISGEAKMIKSSVSIEEVP